MALVHEGDRIKIDIPAKTLHPRGGRRRTSPAPANLAAPGTQNQAGVSLPVQPHGELRQPGRGM